MTPTYPSAHKEVTEPARRINRLPHFVFEPGEWSVEMQGLIDIALRDEHGILAEFLRGQGQTG
jgi:hypothetical protein